MSGGPGTALNRYNGPVPDAYLDHSANLMSLYSVRNLIWQIGLQSPECRQNLQAAVLDGDEGIWSKRLV